MPRVDKDRGDLFQHVEHLEGNPVDVDVAIAWFKENHTEDDPIPEKQSFSSPDVTSTDKAIGPINYWNRTHGTSGEICSLLDDAGFTYVKKLRA